MKKNDTILVFNNTPTRGVFKAKDQNQLPLLGLWEGSNKKYINLTFVECQESPGLECRADVEIESFLASHYLGVIHSDNFIDFESVDELESTLQKKQGIAFWDRIENNKQPGRVYRKTFREHRAKLYDDRLNFMGLGSAKEIEYLNLDDAMKMLNSDFTK